MLAGSLPPGVPTGRGTCPWLPGCAVVDGGVVGRRWVSRITWEDHVSASVTTAGRRSSSVAATPDYPLVVASASLAVVTITAWAVVQAWAMGLVLGIPLLVASHLAYRNRRAAAAIAGLLALALVVVWFVTGRANGFTAGLSTAEVYSGVVFLALGPVAMVTLVLAARDLFRRS